MRQLDLVDSGAWGATSTCTVVWAVDTPPADQVAELLPGMRVTKVFAEDAEELSRIAFDAAVGEIPRGAVIDVLVAAEGIAVVHSHALGDASTSMRLVLDVLDACGLQRLPVRVPRESTGAATVRQGITALTRLWARHPVAPFTVARGLLRYRTERRRLRKRASDTGAGHDRVVLRHFATGDGARVPSMTMAGIIAEELRGAGIESSWTVLVSLRRHSVGLAAAQGNVIGVLTASDTDLASPSANPSPSARIKAGEVLFVVVAKALMRQMVGTLRRPTRSTERAAVQPELSLIPQFSWSDRGRSGPWGHIRWAAGSSREDRAVYVFAAPPSSGSTFNVSWVGDDCFISAIITPDLAVDVDAALSALAARCEWTDVRSSAHHEVARSHTAQDEPTHDTAPRGVAQHRSALGR